MTTKRTPKPKQVTYLGRRATNLTENLGGGVKRSTITWINDATESNGGHPAGTTVVRTYRGDGRDASFELISEEITAP